MRWRGGAAVAGSRAAAWWPIGRRSVSAVVSTRSGSAAAPNRAPWGRGSIAWRLVDCHQISVQGGFNRKVPMAEDKATATCAFTVPGELVASRATPRGLLAESAGRLAQAYPNQLVSH
jgi:hypothetical protein